jgi:hypothetical protein
MKNLSFMTQSKGFAHRFMLSMSQRGGWSEPHPGDDAGSLRLPLLV